MGADIAGRRGTFDPRTLVGLLWPVPADSGRLDAEVARSRRGSTDMAKVQGEITIRRPVAVVFDYVADQTNEPAYNPAMVRAEKVTDGPIGTGTRFMSAVRSGRRVAEMVIETTTYDRPRLLTSTTTMEQMDIEYTLTFDPVVEGTRMRWIGDVRPRGGLRLLGPLVGWLGTRQERRIWSSLKDHLESSTAGGSPTER
jgi:hypothetical protein